ncbi:rab11 family-interacting protein 1 isoform X1 [Taeniopygia guttata]|uniref:rab11 family-interacting protein 1 isoform X1 n=1 Tax=Taeniopygia guttata TaxID=59729 RepID=UPI003BB85BDE
MAGPAPGWAPTHVRVTVLRARGLRAKAAAGGSDAYAVMALGRDKFRTSVAERCRGEPLWREEATFELPPRPAALRLTVLHRALAGADKFLGRAEVELGALRDGGGPRHTRWYKLRSKPGKKEKERGEIEVDIQFMRSNMTASMFDLSMKDKPRSPFGKLKDKLKGKRSSGLSDTASEIVPSTSHSPADSEDEAVEKEKKKSKFKALFSKPGLQKTSLSQSMSVLPTQQPLTQRVRLRPSDFQAQWDEEEPETSPASERSFESVPDLKPAPSPLFKSRKPAFLDSRQLTQGTTNHTKKDGLSLFTGLKSKSDPMSKSSLCINGSHIYMEETTMKDKTPTSSPSPHNLRRKQLFASEENLSSRSTKSPEEMGRTSSGQAFSGSTSLETFKSMTLPSYKLLSSEEHLDTSVPPSIEAVRETKKPDHKKPALLSLVTGKKETVKPSDAEIIPDRALQSEGTIPEEKREEEAKCPEAPADLGRRSPSGDAQHTEEAVTTKQQLGPCEEEQKPEKAAPAKTKAVKPRLGLSPEEEPKATLPTLAPDPLPAFLSVHRISSANNPFVSEVGQPVQVPDSENITSTPASLTSPALAAELWNDKNPFTPEWDRASRALDPSSITHFPSSHHPAASVPKVPLPGQVSARGNNPFAADWGQGPEGSEVSWGLSGPRTPSVPSDCPFNDTNPFVSKRGGQAAPASQAGSSPSCLPGGEDCSSAGHPARGASGGSADVALAVPDPLGTLSHPPSGPPGLAPEPRRDSARLQPEDSLESSKPGRGKYVSFVPGEWQGVPSGDVGLGGQEGGEQPLDSSGRLQVGSGAAGERAEFVCELGAGGDPWTELSGDSTHRTWDSDGAAVEVTGVSTEPCTRGDKGFVSQAPSPRSELRKEQETCGGKQRAECVPMLEPQAPPPAGNEPLSQVQPVPRACTVSPGEGEPGRAGSEVPVPPKPAPRLAVLLRKSPATPQAELRADVPASGDGAQSTPGLPFPETSAARGCLPQGGLLGTVTPAVTPRGKSSGRPLEKEGGDLSVSLTNVRSAIPVPGDRGSAPAGLPVIPEGGSDDELLGDCQDSCGATAGDRGVLGNGEQPRGLTPLHGEQRELSDSSAAAPGGGAGAIPGACEPGSLAVLPAAVGAPRVCVQGADSGLGVTSHSRECDSHFGKQELESSVGVEERAECDFSEPSAFSSSLSSPCQPHSSSHSLLSDTPSRRAESPKKPTAEGFADKAGNSGKKKLLQARVSPSETFPNQSPRGAETVSPQHRLHPVKPMNAMANKPQSKNLNVISTMNEKLLEMSVKKYDPSDPAYAYAQLTHDELIQLVLKQKDTITRKDLQVRELEDYIDNLLVRVMEETPNILRVSMSGNRKAGKM